MEKTNDSIQFNAASQIKYVKHKVDALDKENLTYSYSLIEGDTLLEKMESITFEVKFEANPEGGYKGKNTSIYTTKPGIEINEEETKGGKAKAAALFKLVEGYLLANPEACA